MTTLHKIKVMMLTCLFKSQPTD